MSYSGRQTDYHCAVDGCRRYRIGRKYTSCYGIGADGVQIGTRFALTEESSAHFTFKDRCLRLNEGDTQLTLKQLSPVRLVKNDFFKQVEEAESRGATTDELRTLLGKGRAKRESLKEIYSKGNWK